MRPLRLQILTAISGVEFSDCFAGRPQRNQRATGRAKDLADLDELA